MTMRLLVTGGAGFIGSHLVQRLLAEGNEVWIADDFSSGKPANLARSVRAGLDPARICRVDIRDPEFDGVVATARPDVLVHLAAQSQVNVSMREPLHDLDVNVMGFARVIAAAQRHGVQRLVLASSGGTIYGTSSLFGRPTPEGTPRQPASFYGLSKNMADEYCRLQQRTYGIQYVSLAIGNVYGAGQDPHRESGVLAIFANRLRRGQPCEITGDGSAVRDFVHVKDVVEAFALALTHGSGLINVGTGVGTSILSAYQMLIDHASLDQPPVFVDGRPGEVNYIVLDPARAWEELRWQPAIPLSAGIDDLLPSHDADMEGSVAGRHD